MAVLVGARLVQGVGAAMLVPSSLSLLRASYEQPSERARAVGVWGATAGTGAASGPVLGGLLVASISWRAVFVVNVPVGVAALLLARRHLPDAGERAGQGLDPPGQALGIVALTLVTFGLIEGGAAGWGSPLALIPLIAFVPAIVAFLLVERGVRQPMMPLSLFSSREFSGASFVGLAINLGFYGQLFAIVLYFRHVRSYSALEAGLALLPEGVFVAVASSVSGRITARVGPRLPMICGTALGALGFAGLIAAGHSTSYALLVPALVAAGFGMALTMPAATAAVIESAPASRSGIASGVLNAGRQAGGAIGVALLGTLIASGSFVPGLHVAMACLAAAFAMAAVVSAVAVRRAD